MAPLLLGKSGALYGTTFEGGANECAESGIIINCGTVFELIPPPQAGGSWTENYFSMGPQSSHGGAYINAGLALDQTGKLYAAATVGGTGGCLDTFGFIGGCGAVFELSPPAQSGGRWRSEIIYNFTGVADGGLPVSSLLSEGGNLYGVAPGGGDKGFCRVQIDAAIANGCGTVFQLTPPATGSGTWTETTLYQFADESSGSEPWGGITSGGNGNFFGTTAAGGTAGLGTVFEVTQ
jgi:uncharacterized protein YceK